MRNVLTYAEHGKRRLSKHPRDISAGEVMQILNEYKDDISEGKCLDLLVTSYYFGVESGYRQAEADLKAKSK